MKIHWTDLAVSHLADIHEYIARSSEQYALRLVDRLTRRSQQLANFPYSGRIVPEKNDPTIRELFEGPYRIIYRVRADRIDVLAVIHGAREWPFEEGIEA